MNLITSTLAAFLVILTHASALGINCRGSGECLTEPIDDAMQLTNLLNNIDPARWYNDGEQIVCLANVCAYLQNTNSGASGATVQNLAHFIPEHGCHTCGSVPLNFAFGDNDVADGELTFNFARNPCLLSTINGFC